MKKILIFLLLFAGCDQGTEPDKNIGRIIIDNNIDGLKLGDDSLTVTRLLGYPNSITFPATPSVVYIYTTGTHAIMSVTIHYRNGVNQISVSGPYPGKTQNGIGVGSTRTFVISKLGQPGQHYDQTNGILDEYSYTNSTLMINYDSVNVLAISMSAK